MSAGNNPPTDTEVLFFALQIVQRAETAAEAKVWAQEVLRFSGGSTEADVWPPPGAAEWQGKGSKPAPLYERMDNAYNAFENSFCNRRSPLCRSRIPRGREHAEQIPDRQKSR